MIVDRMIMGLQSLILIIVLSILMLLALVLDFFELAHFLLAGKGSGVDVLLMIILRLSTWLNLLLPVALVGSTCIVFALLGGTQQLAPWRRRALTSYSYTHYGCHELRYGGHRYGSGVLDPPALNKMEPLMIRSFGRIDSTWRFFKNHQWYRGMLAGSFGCRKKVPTEKA